MAYYYFALRADDPVRTAYKEEETTIEELRKQFVGKAIQVGDEEHDIGIITDIWTEEKARAYYEG